MTCSVRLEQERLEPDRELRNFIESANEIGAVVSFVGIVRAGGRDGVVDTLVLEHHPTLTESSMSEIANEALHRFGLSHVRVVHRCGRLAAGEPIVFVAAASLHRRAAFEAADFLMDQLKTDAVFWKREEGREGRRWIEPTAADYEAKKRWVD